MTFLRPEQRGLSIGRTHKLYRSKQCRRRRERRGRGIKRSPSQADGANLCGHRTLPACLPTDRKLAVFCRFPPSLFPSSILDNQTDRPRRPEHQQRNGSVGRSQINRDLSLRGRPIGDRPVPPVRPRPSANPGVAVGRWGKTWPRITVVREQGRGGERRNSIVRDEYDQRI